MSSAGSGSVASSDIIYGSDSRSVGSANDELVLEEEQIDLSVSDYVIY